MRMYQLAHKWEGNLKKERTYIADSLYQTAENNIYCKATIVQ